MGRGRQSWRLVLAAVICVAAALASGPDGSAEAAFRRPRVIWTIDAPTLSIDRCEKESFVPKLDLFEVHACPGVPMRIALTVTPDADVIAPRLVLQTPSGARILRIENDPLGTTIPSGETRNLEVVIDIPPSYRNLRGSGRLYLADRGSVLVAPMNIRVVILHPTPEEKALTPVVTPTNHIKMMRDTFNIKLFTVVSGTNVTWTNKDTQQHSVIGQLCRQFTGTCDPYDLPPAGGARCAQLVNGAPICIDSGPLDPQRQYTLRITRPDRTQPIRYAMNDGLEGYSKCQRDDVPLCFLTVK